MKWISPHHPLRLLFVRAAFTVLALLTSSALGIGLLAKPSTSLKTGESTSTTVASSANPYSATGVAITFTATVTGNTTTPNQGTVTFTENGTPLAGAPNGGIANVVNGVATISTSGVPEGDHVVTATFHDSTNTFDDSFGTVTIRLDMPTGMPTLNGSTWTYCNTAPITIPLGQSPTNDFGPASPNPSNINVSNLPGRINSVSVALNGFYHVRPQNLQTLLVGPNGAAAPTAAQTLDFFSGAGGINPVGPINLTFSDTAGSALSTTSLTSGTFRPSSFNATTYTASPFFTLPATHNYAANQGTSTLNGVFGNQSGNGIWSLYFNQTVNAVGSGVNSGWCLNFQTAPVTGVGITSHVGGAPNNNFRQGGTGSVTFSLVNNGFGPTGDPDQTVAHAMTVAGTLPTGLKLGTLPTGTPWNCSSSTSTTFSCTNLNAIAQGASYELLTIPVNVASNAPSSVTVSAISFGGAGMTAGSFSTDAISIDPAPALAISKGHSGNFTQGSTGTWTIQVINGGAPAAVTDGSAVTVYDPLPSGYTLASYSGTGWTCSGTNIVTCTSTEVVAGGGGTFNAINLTVNVPANSPVLVANIAYVWGGGDPNHTGLPNATIGNDSVSVIQVPATIHSFSNNLTTSVNTAFPGVLSVEVLDAGGVRIPGAQVTFTAPSTGASGTFNNGTNAKTVTAGIQDVASAGPFTANNIPGT